MTKEANSAPPVPHWVSTDGKGCHLDLPAVEMFHKKMDSAFGKLNGLSETADNTFVYGKSEKGHDQRILNVLDKAGDNNVLFNPDMVHFKLHQHRYILNSEDT